MYDDIFEFKVNDTTTLKCRRLTVKEIHDAQEYLTLAGDERLWTLVRSHVTSEDFDPTLLSLPQMTALVKELCGVPDGNPLSDFIGLFL